MYSNHSSWLQGEVFLKFDNVQSGERAVKALNGRWFGGKQASTLCRFSFYNITTLVNIYELNRSQLHLCQRLSIMRDFPFNARVCRLNNIISHRSPITLIHKPFLSRQFRNSSVMFFFFSKFSSRVLAFFWLTGPNVVFSAQSSVSDVICNKNLLKQISQ